MFFPTLKEESLAGKYTSAAALFDLMDLLAGRIAYNFAECMCTTVSIDRVDLINPILHTDLIRVEGKVVSVGSSSMVIHVKAFRHDIQTRQFNPVAYSYITYVAIDPSTMRPKKNIPKLKVVDEEERKMQEEAEKRKTLTTEWKAVQKLAASAGRQQTPRYSIRPQRRSTHH